MRKHCIAWAAMAVALIALVAAISGVAAASPSSGPKASPKAHAASSRGPRGPRGFPGPRGLKGDRGPQGAAGVVPQIVTVDSPKESLAPGQTTFDVDPNGFQATCPSGYTVIGTGYDGDIGETVSVIDYGGFFVGGFVINDTSIPISPVYVQAICAVVPSGSTGADAADRASLATEEAAYQADLKRAAAR
jgi:hypothetical protein